MTDADRPARPRTDYTGASGQLAVMAEFLYRGLNVAVPVVDTGDDVFVVRDQDDSVTRVQVKSANGAGGPDAYRAKFSLPLAQLRRGEPPLLVYVFAVRHAGRWRDFFIVRRPTLWRLRRTRDVGSLFTKRGRAYLSLTLSITRGDARNKGVSFQQYRDAWEPWPPREEVGEEPAGTSDDLG